VKVAVRQLLQRLYSLKLLWRSSPRIAAADWRGRSLTFAVKVEKVLRIGSPRTLSTALG